MTVLLVLATFLVFVALDILISRRKAPVQFPSEAKRPLSAALEPDYVDGFLTPKGLDYHPGHAWIRRERPHYMRVGADEFAAALAGSVDGVELPRTGQWVRQGQRTLTLHRGDEKTEMVSPIEGEVVEVNTEVVKYPTLLRSDPYGRGWLFAVHVPDEESTARNLVPSALIRSWMRNAVERLYALQPQVAGAVLADGGRPAEDPLAGIPNVSWGKVTREFFLT
jgi:glycine cleavage system H protein